MLLRDKVESTTDADARLYRKSAADKSVPCYQGHAMIENCNGLVVAAEATVAGNASEREAAVAILDRTLLSASHSRRSGRSLWARTRSTRTANSSKIYAHVQWRRKANLAISIIHFSLITTNSMCSNQLRSLLGLYS